MKRVICPGSFDPVTNGHLDIFLRAAKMFDEVIISVFHNPNKQTSMFTMQERVEMLQECTKEIANIKVECFSGLLNDYVKEKNATAILRGLRALSDFEYEFNRALMIKKIDSQIETVFMMTSLEYSFLSSSGVRELLAFGSSVKGFVPGSVESMIKNKVKGS